MKPKSKLEISALAALPVMEDGGGIHIKKKNRGKFTASAKAAGQSVQEHASSVLSNPNASALQKKRANFARNAAKWHHENGGRLQILPSFITPVVPDTNHYEDGGDMEAPEGEGGEGFMGGMDMPTGMFSSINKVGNEVIDKQWDDPNHGVSVGKESIKQFQTRSAQGADIGANFGPWGLLIGAAVGSTIGGIEGTTGAIKDNKKYNKQFKEDYLDVQAQEMDPLFARNGGHLYGDGGQLPKLASNGELPFAYNEYNGNLHEAGGIAVGDNEVEHGEVRWEDYIFSDNIGPSENFSV